MKQVVHKESTMLERMKVSTDCLCLGTNCEVEIVGSKCDELKLGCRKRAYEEEFHNF
jgi:hypothetical protein